MAAHPSEDEEQGEHLCIAGVSANLYSPFEIQCRFLRKFGINLPQEPDNSDAASITMITSSESYVCHQLIED